MPNSKKLKTCRLSPWKDSDRQMVKRSKGNSKNERHELKQLSLIEWDCGLPALEIVRSSPKLCLKTPTTFAEEARHASLRMKEREMSNATSFSRPTTSSLVPRKIFSPVAQTDSSGSYNGLGLSPCSTIPPTLSPMSPLGNPVETEVTGQLLSLTINDELSRTSDSFSSSPDTAWNKGAIAFIDLLEGFLARQALEADALRFESLVVEMMDINISSKVPTSGHIATTLNEKVGVCRRLQQYGLYQPTTL